MPPGIHEVETSETPAESSDRRGAVRYPCSSESFSLENSCRPITALKKESWPATVRDLSTGGIGIIVSRRFEPGTLLAVDLQDATQSVTRALLVRVVHVTKENKVGWFLGCAFTHKMTESELLGLM